MREGAIGRSGAALLLLAICAMPASADDLPTRKAGLWEITSGMGGRSVKMQQCVDAATDHAMQTRAGTTPHGDCSKRDVQKSGDHDDDRFRLHDRWQNQDLAHRHRRQLRQRVHVTVTSPDRGSACRRPPATLGAKWLGPCAADQKPGDMIMPNGMKMNIQSMQNMQKGMVPPGAAGAPPGH